MTKWEIVSLISEWQKHKYDRNHLEELMNRNKAISLRDITSEQAQAYYDEHAGEYSESEELQYGR